jgi:hypothetical protein
MARKSTTSQRHTAAGAAELHLSEQTTALLDSRLSATAERTVRAVIVGVPAYADALAGPLGTDIESAVQAALGGFLRLVGTPAGSDAQNPLARALEGAYELGRREARGGRTMDALLAAYRVGARESWRQFSRTAIETKVPSETMAKFAELVFAYIDELSAACAAGHADELAITGRVRARYRQGLTLSLLRGDAPESLRQRAERASWEPPQTLAAVLLPTGHAPHAMASLDARTLRADEDLPELDDQERVETTVLLVTDAHGPRRPAIAAALRGLGAYLGPAKPWTDARTSYLRALRARRLALPSIGAVCDTEQHLTRLVVGADPAALADLRAQVLAPLVALRAPSADRLTETLREWLGHRGRRDGMAAALHVHPQTVRYRMTQLRELYGERLDDPQLLTALTIALNAPADQSPAQS